MSYHYAGFHCNCRLRLAIKERGEPRRQEVDEDGRTCRSRWKGEIIVGARDSHAKHPLYLEPASQGVWNHRNAPINLILPFAGSSPMPPSLLYLPLTFFLPASTFLLYGSWYRTPLHSPSRSNRISMSWKLRTCVAVVSWYFQFLRQSHPSRSYATIQWILLF